MVVKLTIHQRRWSNEFELILSSHSTSIEMKTHHNALVSGFCWIFSPSKCRIKYFKQSQEREREIVSWEKYSQFIKRFYFSRRVLLTILLQVRKTINTNELNNYELFCGERKCQSAIGENGWMEGERRREVKSASFRCVSDRKREPKKCLGSRVNTTASFYRASVNKQMIPLPNVRFFLRCELKTCFQLLRYFSSRICSAPGFSVCWFGMHFHTNDSKRLTRASLYSALWIVSM